MTNREFAAKLRELADVYEQNESIPQPYQLGDVGELVFCHKLEDLRATIKAFGSGEKMKDEQGSIIFVPRRFPMIKVYGLLEGVCKRVPVGTRIVPAVPERIIAAEPPREETIYETRCPKSLLEDSAEQVNGEEIGF
jgi:hypothetical protein